MMMWRKLYVISMLEFDPESFTDVPSEFTIDSHERHEEKLSQYIELRT